MCPANHNKAAKVETRSSVKNNRSARERIDGGKVYEAPSLVRLGGLDSLILGGFSAGGDLDGAQS